VSKVEIHKCDRCGKFCDDAQHVRVTIDGGENVHEVDLCDPCERDLTLFLDGSKLARQRKAAP
jgi:hypothetical protein